MSGLRTSLKDPDLQENVYVYDDAGRLSKMQVAASRTAYFAYDASGMVVRRHAPLNEVVAYFTYDSAARLKQLENRTVNGSLLSYFAYQRNPLGAQTWIRHEGAEDTYFEYDPLDRLTREFRTPTGTARSHDDYYAYDAVGNRVLKVDRTASQNVYYTFDSRNLLAKEWNKDAPETTYFAYDAARRMTSLKLPGGQSSYFTHDQRDQVKKIEFAKASSPDSTQEFGYTGQGERVSLKIGTGSSMDLRLAYDGKKLLTEKNAASGSATVRRYRHNRGLLDCMGSAIEWDFGGQLRYGSFNGQGTLVGLRVTVMNESVNYPQLRDSFGRLITTSTPPGGGDFGKLQFLTSGLLDLQLQNVQIDPLVWSGQFFLPKQGLGALAGGRRAFLGAQAVRLMSNAMLGRISFQQRWTSEQEATTFVGSWRPPSLPPDLLPDPFGRWRVSDRNVPGNCAGGRKQGEFPFWVFVPPPHGGWIRYDRAVYFCPEPFPGRVILVDYSTGYRVGLPGGGEPLLDEEMADRRRAARDGVDAASQRVADLDIEMQELRNKQADRTRMLGSLSENDLARDQIEKELAQLEEELRVNADAKREASQDVDDFKSQVKEFKPRD